MSDGGVGWWFSASRSCLCKIFTCGCVIMMVIILTLYSSLLNDSKSTPMYRRPVYQEIHNEDVTAPAFENSEQDSPYAQLLKAMKSLNHFNEEQRAWESFIKKTGSDSPKFQLSEENLKGAGLDHFQELFISRKETSENNRRPTAQLNSRKGDIQANASRNGRSSAKKWQMKKPQSDRDESESDE